MDAASALNRATACSAAPSAPRSRRPAAAAGCGRVTGSDSREMALGDLNVLWGTNPVSTQVNVMAHVTRARKERGAKLVVIDPDRTGSAASADMHLAVRPGTDAALACAVMHPAFRDGHADRAYMAAYTNDPATLEAHLASRGPDWAAPSRAWSSRSRPSRRSTTRRPTPISAAANPRVSPAPEREP